MSIPKDPIQAKIYRENLSKSLTGRKISEEAKKKMSKAKGGKKKKKKSYPYNPDKYQKNKEQAMKRQTRYRNNPEKREEYLRKARIQSKKYYEENSDKRYAYNKIWWKNHIKKLEEVMGRKRPTQCEICGNSGRISFDHDHKTGKARGWICMKCNTTLGKVNDDVKILQKMINYLSSAQSNKNE